MEIIRKISQVALGVALMFAGISHLTTSRAEFQAQVPNLFASQADFVVLVSGVVEIMLGLALVVWALWSTGAWRSFRENR